MAKTKLEPQNPLILRSHRLMEAFAKSDEERDFYLDRQEGFIIYVDLDKPIEELSALEQELKSNPDNYVLIPKMTFYETKKIMEGFVNEKVYDIDTKEKLLDIIQSKEARENFLEFLYDHHSELEKWQQYYQERARIRIIEWLRNNHFHFVFEEDLDLTKGLVEKLKLNLFNTKVGKEILNARKALVAKAKTYYSSEALNPRPKRGRPPKQVVKQESEPQVTTDVYTTVPSALRPFLFSPDFSSFSALTFSSKFESEEDLIANRKRSGHTEVELSLEEYNAKLASLRGLSVSTSGHKNNVINGNPFDDDDDEEEEDEEEFEEKRKAKKRIEKKPSKKAAKPLKPEKAKSVKTVKAVAKPIKQIKEPAKPKKPVAKIKPKVKPTIGKASAGDTAVKKPKRLLPKKPKK